MNKVILILSILLSTYTFGQLSLLQSGPMVGYSEMREVGVWIQLRDQAEVYMEYQETSSKGKTYRTGTYKTEKQNAYCVTMIADDVEPGRKYDYSVYINGVKLSFPYPTRFQTQSLWQWRTDPPDFKFTAGSCFYINEEEYDRPGRPYGGGYEIVSSIHSVSPDFMIWLGDNFYLRETDWYSKTGYHKRATHSSSLPQLQPLLASTHHYATWDDHDYGPNDSDRTWKLKNTAVETFQTFWANPPFDIDLGGGITNYFQWADCDFYLLDNRYHKSPNSQPGVVLGERQLEWLKSMLLESEASFKFISVGGMVLSTAARFENLALAAPKEREDLIKFIQEKEIKGVIFLTGDRHFAELSLIEEEGKVSIYDFTTSPLTAGPASAFAREEQNENRVSGTTFFDRNFAEISVKGDLKNRIAILKLKNSNGEEIWSREIKK